MLKITSIEVIPIRVPLKKPKKFALRTVKAREYVIVKIFEEGGLSGWGYTWGPCVISQIIEDLLNDLILGEDPRHIQKLWDKMYRGTLVWGRRGLLVRAMSTIDIALWDLLGKITGQSICHLLGGYREVVPAYYSGGYYLEDFERPSDYVEYIEEEFGTFKDRGFTAFKMKVGAVHPSIDLLRVKKAREIIGDDDILMLDANSAWGLDIAIKRSHEFSVFNPYWLEEPLMPDEISGLAQLRQKTTIPIAVGENHFTRWEFQQMLQHQAVDYIQGDPIIMGGITEFQRLYGMVSCTPVSLAPHNSHNINTQVGGGIGEVQILEYFALESDVFNFDVFLKNPVQPDSQGYLKVYDDPGHGLELDEDAIEKYRVH